MGLFSFLKSLFITSHPNPPVTDEELGAIRRVSEDVARKSLGLDKTKKPAKPKAPKKPEKPKKPAKPVKPEKPKKPKAVKVKVDPAVVEGGKKIGVDVLTEVENIVVQTTGSPAEISVEPTDTERKEYIFDTEGKVKTKKPRKPKKAVDSPVDPATVKIDE